jgi:ABC-type transporter Mla subunit MlaD
MLIAAIFGSLLLAGLAYLALTAENGLPLLSYYYLNAKFKNASQIDTYSDVRIAGKLVGQVLGSSLQNGQAVVRLQLDPSEGLLRSSTTARIRLQGLLGAKYVELTPGRTGRRLRSGATLPVSQTSTTVDVFDVLAMFDARRREDLRGVLGGLGQGFLGRGPQLNQALQSSPGVVYDLGQLASAVNGRTGAAARLIPEAQSLSGAVDPVRTELAQGFAPGARALAPWTVERRSTQEALTLAPPALSAIHLGLSQTDPLLVQTAALSHELVRLTGPAPAALEAATRLLRASSSPLRRTRTLLTTLSGAVPPTLGLLDRVAPLTAPSTRSLTNTIPGLYELGRYTCDIESWANDWYRLFELGIPPASSAGLTGFIRVAFVVDKAATEANRPGAIASTWYPAPCTENLQREP